jgi:hypothetical protein
LSSGFWYKIAVEKNGVYKISYDQLRKMGFDVSHIDPRTIKIYGRVGGMLPQPNATPRADDLVELSIFVNGEADGILHKGDYILFYGEGPDRVKYIPEKTIFAYESNLYSTQNFYFVTSGNAPGKRLTTSPNLGTGSAVVNTFEDYAYHELDTYNELHSGREWFGERFDLTTSYTFDIEAEGIINNSTIKWVSDVMAQSYTGSSFKLSFNNSDVAQQTVTSIPNAQYGVKGMHKRDTITFIAANISSGKNQVTYNYTRAATGLSTGFLDFFLLTFKRALALYHDQTIFRSSESLQQGVTTFQISNASAQVLIWDITDPYQPLVQEHTLDGTQARFSTETSSLKEFIVFNSNVTAPKLVARIDNQNLHAIAVPNLLIITHPDFLKEAQRLASYRATHNQWITYVATTDEVYHEFSSGRADVTAIRDFIKYLYNKGSNTLQAVLLFGRGSYDYKNRIQNNTNFVPVYESRNSLSPLETYASDDYYGFLEDNEGNWGEGSPAQNHTLDIGVGRLPVKTLTEAKTVVDKIIAYEADKNKFGTWRKQITFVADDGNTTDGFIINHQLQANTLAENIEANDIGFNTRKIFLGTYEKSISPSGETIPKAKDDILESFDRGSLIINYTGHGSEKVWADERVLTDNDILSLKNKHYPFLVTATCEFGRNDDPVNISSAELSILQPNGGSIGLVTTARPVISNTNYALNQAFYQALFQKQAGYYLALGETFRRTKNNSTSGVGNRNFSLIGDPSMRLAMPVLNVTLDVLKTSTGSDTLKALSTVMVQGTIDDQSGTVVTNFNGVLEATLFDKQTDFITIGKNDPAFTFKQWYNPLFRGKASVQNGTFSFQMMLPKNIAYQVGKGKLSLYAFDAAHDIDATGERNDFNIGGSEANPPGDNQPPQLVLYMGDTTFVNGGFVNKNTTLLAFIKDDRGINISNYGIGNTMIAVLDNDQQTFVLNDYFSANQDDPTSGWVDFPLKDLTPGKHKLTVKVWDVYNNPAQATIDFVVTTSTRLAIESFGNYPNPFQKETTIFFTHNHSGDDLEAKLYLYTADGVELSSFTYTITSSPYEVKLLELNDLRDLGKKLQNGLYFARLAVRSLTDGSESMEVTKLILAN